MKVSINISTSKEAPEFTVSFTFGDLTQQDINALLNRSEMPLTAPIGATLISKSPLAALEVFASQMVFLNGEDSDAMLTTLRKRGYLVAAIQAQLNLLPEEDREVAKEAIFRALSGNSLDEV